MQVLKTKTQEINSNKIQEKQINLDFIQINENFFSNVLTIADDFKGILLVEKNTHPILSHSNAVFACMIRNAKNLKIGWIDCEQDEINNRLLSYDKKSFIIQGKKNSFFEKFKINLVFFITVLKLLATNNILQLKIEGIKFGDLLYDSYLGSFYVATIKNVNLNLIKLLHVLINRYFYFKKIIKTINPSAVLVSHQINLNSGVLFRVALKYKIPTYLRSGGNKTVSLKKYSSIHEMYDFQMKPTPFDLNFLQKINPNKIEKEFNSIIKQRMNTSTDKDAKLAYQKDKKIFYNKQQFNIENNLKYNNKNIVVMLHAFNDYPNSHFGKMIFKDYYDWFYNTLEFAKQKTDVNWIFKEHPASRYYKTLDICLSDYFKIRYEHIKFFNAESSFNTKSLLHIADAILTVTGTAGIEFASTAGIPCILAGKSFYSELGVTFDLKTKKEYFAFLSKIESIKKLDPKVQYQAKLIFLFVEKYWSIPFNWSPHISYEETIEPNLNKHYWQKVINQYDTYKSFLEEQFLQCSKIIEKDTFSKLTSYEVLKGE
ncbi:hypothetical protein K9M16_04110 [Candidatus Babeliales bacterium]|nr:hypothetical protein [Candidatus Babeliales bacterium]